MRLDASLRTSYLQTRLRARDVIYICVVAGQRRVPVRADGRAPFNQPLTLAKKCSDSFLIQPIWRSYKTLSQAKRHSSLYRSDSSRRRQVPKHFKRNTKYAVLPFMTRKQKTLADNLNFDSPPNLETALLANNSAADRSAELATWPKGNPTVNLLLLCCIDRQSIEQQGSRLNQTESTFTCLANAHSSVFRLSSKTRGSYGLYKFPPGQ